MIKGPNQRKGSAFSVSPLIQDQLGASRMMIFAVRGASTTTFQSGSSTIPKLTPGYSHPSRRPNLLSWHRASLHKQPPPSPFLSNSCALSPPPQQLSLATSFPSAFPASSKVGPLPTHPIPSLQAKGAHRQRSAWTPQWTITLTLTLSSIGPMTYRPRMIP